jgi:hypothetical protein
VERAEIEDLFEATSPWSIAQLPSLFAHIGNRSHVQQTAGRRFEAQAASHPPLLDVAMVTVLDKSFVISVIFFLSRGFLWAGVSAKICFQTNRYFITGFSGMRFSDMSFTHFSSRLKGMSHCLKSPVCR